ATSPGSSSSRSKCSGAQRIRCSASRPRARRRTSTAPFGMRGIEGCSRSGSPAATAARSSTRASARSSCRAGRSTASRRCTPSCSTSSGIMSMSRSEKTMSSDVPAATFGACPLPFPAGDRILIGHGSGGLLTARLVEELLVPAFRNPALERLDDAAVLAVDGGARIALTTDSYVVTPIFFPGGDIGELAVNGTVNDLAVSGARPIALSLAFILEEGLPMADLRRVVESARAAAAQVGVPIVTGDTKVVGRGSGDQIFVNTSGVGIVPAGVELSSTRVRPGDAILLSGEIGEHGVAILACREGLELEGDLSSDTA